MPNYQFRVIPFMGRIKGSGSADEVSAQLQSAIAALAREGWEFDSLGNVNIEVQPGCLGALLGAKANYVRYDQLIFRQRME